MARARAIVSEKTDPMGRFFYGHEQCAGDYPGEPMLAGANVPPGALNDGTIFPAFVTKARANSTACGARNPSALLSRSIWSSIVHLANLTRSASTANGLTANSTTNRPDTPMLQPDLADFMMRLDQWAAAEEHGARAEDIIKTWLEGNNTEAVLNLSELGLQSLPPLPEGLKKLKADKNCLRFIPENHLPASLEALDVHLNQLTTLPETLPIANMRLLNAANNQIASLPNAALNLHRECKVYLKGNPLDEAVLTGQFGPEQNANGLRQYSTASQAQRPQAAPARQIASKMLAGALPAAEMPEGFSIEQLAANLPDVGRFCVFLTHVRATVCYQHPNFRQTLAQLIVQIAGDSKLGAKACELAGELRKLDHYQVATVFHKIRMSAIDRQIDSGSYDGRAADIVAHLRRKFRFNTVISHSVPWVLPRVHDKTPVVNTLTGSIAAFNNEICDLGFDMADVNNWNGTTPPDPIQLLIIGSAVKKDECEKFASYLCRHASLAAKLLSHADPRIAAIMSKTSDAMGNPVSGDALTAMHLRDLKEYFTSTGQPDLTLPVWDISKEPLNVNIHRGKQRPSGTVELQNADCKMQ